MIANFDVAQSCKLLWCVVLFYIYLVNGRQR